MKRLFSTCCVMTTLAMALAGCNGCQPGDEHVAEGSVKKSADAEADIDPATGMSVAEVDSEAPAAEALAPARSLKELAPVMREVADGGGAPTRIVIELSRRVVKRAGPAPKGTSVVVEPAVAGEPTLTYLGPSTLEYKLPSGRTFANDTRYTVTLEAIANEGGDVLRTDDGPKLQHTFTTPPFRLERVGFGQHDPVRKRVVLDVVFTGPVDAKAVEANTTVYVRDERATLAVEQTGNPSVVRAVVSSGRIEPGVNVRVRTASIPSSQDRAVVAQGGTHRVEVPVGPELRILSAHVSEAADGFVLHVVCLDEEAGEGETYFWDDHVNQSWRVSPRCELHQAARDAIHVTPDPGAISVSPARGGFQVHGDFKRGTYAVRIDAGAHSVDGSVLLRTYESTLTVPARSPRLDFVAQGRYLPRNAWNRLALRHLNVDEATLQVRHVRPENLVFWMSHYSEQADQRSSEVVAKRKLAFRGVSDAPSTAWLDLAAMLPSDTKGLLEVSVSAKGARGDTRRLVLTDMNLVAKQGEREVMVWAFGIHDNKPLSGVDVKLVTQSGLPLGRCATSADGGCRIEPKDESADLPRERFALVATKGDDLTYLKFADLKTEIADTDVQGTPYSDKEAPYRAALYSDRGVYRPGEMVHIVGVVRDGNGKLPKEGMPVEMQLLDPKHKLVKKHVLQTNAAGVVTKDVTFGDFAETGRYVVTMLAGTKPLGSYGFNVEEFVPERMKVDVSIKPKAVHASEAVPVDVTARYLFGGSASGGRFEVACDLVPSTFRPTSLKEYEFGVWHPDNKAPRPLNVGKAQGTLGEEGTGSVSCPPIEKGGGLAGPAKLIARASVFESGSGRTTVNETTVPIHSERFYVGLKSSAQSVSLGKPFRVQGVVVGWEGQPLRETPDVKLALYRVSYEYGWSYDEWDGSWNNRYHQRAVLESEQEVKVKDGKFDIELKAAEGASLYLVRATAGNARTDLALESQGYWYHWGYGWDDGGGDATPKPSRPTTLTLDVPSSTQVGATVPVKLKAPYPGRLLVTVETDRIVHHTWMDVQAGDVDWSFTLTDFVANVYVSAFLVKDPHLDSQEAFTPDRGFGVASVKVEPTQFQQALQLEVPSEIRSTSTLEVKLDVGAVSEPTFVTVAAVDEGILQLTKFMSPDPLASIFERRALGVMTFETVGWNLLLPASDTSRSHGGDVGSGPGRVQPVKPVALWSGLVEVKKDGKVTIPLEVPQYRGSLRVMAVAISGEKVGSASKNVLVRDPIVLQTTLPRFLVSDDGFDVPVFLTNLSGKDADVEVTLRTEHVDVPGVTLSKGMKRESPITLKGEPRQTLRLKADESGRVVFSGTARQGFGAARFRVQAKAGTTVVHEDLVVPFAPAGAKVREVKRIKLEQASTDVLPHLQGFVPMTERSTLWVTSTPWGDVFDHLKHLIRYPYGCLEQTASSTRPLLYVGRLVANVDPELVADGGIEKRVMHGVERLLSMQTPSGGFGYWPGDTEPTHWGTAYVVHLMLDAIDGKYPLPKSRVDDAVAWMEQELTYMVERNQSSNGSSYRYFRYSEPYFHYVLARAGKARKARAEKLLHEMEKEPKSAQRDEQLYLLRAALWLGGDRRYEAQLRQLDTTPIVHDRANDWTFYSDARRRGFMLSIFGDLFGDDAAGQQLADTVADHMRTRPSWYWTTQEIVWSTTALGKRLQRSAQRPFEPAVLVANGGKPSAAEVPSGDNKSNDRTWNVYRASEHEQLAVTIAPKDVGNLWLILSSEGVKSGVPIKTGGDGLRVERAFYDGEGREVSLSEVSLGDLIYVVVTLQNTSGRPIQNIALVDRLPAGFEIENPRLGRGGAMDLVDESELWSLDHMNVRDDRLEVFGALGRKDKRSVLYAVRAVTAGSFTLPPVEAEAMYDPSLWARSTGPKVRVRGPWD